MHRHGYKGKKFGRERDQRRALLKGLAESLVLHESIETTLPKAKEVATYTEKLITKAKRGDLHSRRQVIASLSTLQAANKLVDELAPKLSGRSNGHLAIKRTAMRRGDSAQMARVSFVDDLSEKPAKSETLEAEKPKKTAKPAARKAAVKKPGSETSRLSAKADTSKAARRSTSGKPTAKKETK